jgi:hypothetical protein
LEWAPMARRASDGKRAISRPLTARPGQFSARPARPSIRRWRGLPGSRAGLGPNSRH